MMITCYLRKGIVYLPTVARHASSPIYTNIEPIAVVALEDLDAVRQALLESLKRGNPIIPDLTPQELRAPPVILKYARVRSLSVFFRSTSTWSIRDDDGRFKITVYRKHPKGYWEPDPAQEIQFLAGTPVDDVIDRMIAILHEAARTEAKS